MNKEIKVGLFFLAALTIFVVIILKVKHIEFNNNYYDLYAYFAGVSGIENNSPVKLAGLKIGRVIKIEPDMSTNKIRIKIRIDGDKKIRKDAVVKLQMENLMGAKHISVSFGKSNDFFKNNEVITSVEEADIEKLISSITETANETKILVKDLNANQSKVLNKFYDILDDNKNKIKSFIANIEEITVESKPKISNVLDYLEKSMPDLNKSLNNIEVITATIKDGKGTLGKIINDPKLYDELLVSIENIKSSFKRIDNVIAKNEKNIDEIISGLKQTIEPVKTSFTNISQITEKIKNGEGTIGKLISDTELYNTTKHTIEKISENLEDQREQSVMSSFTNTIFGIFKF
ncbi:MCE family protein [Candidatus Dependentiae bacterium]|nr:MCE family protein [Candidatus Dependentiae bacterium]